MKIENFKLKIVFFGSSRFVIPIIEVLNKNFDLALVVTTEKEYTDAVPAYCVKNKIHHISVSNLSDPNFKFQIGVLASFGAIIPKEVLNLFPKGIINIHPSLLPKYRGPTPVQTAILNGEKTTGVTIIKLDEEVDHGPILMQKEEPIFQNDTTESLHSRLFKIGAGSIVQTIELYLKGDIKPREQNHKNATFTNRLTRADGYIDLSSLKIENLKLKIDRMIRAYHPWPGVWTEFRIQNSEFRIKFLPENKIQVEGKKPMSYKDFENGYPKVGKEVLEKLKLSQ